MGFFIAFIITAAIVGFAIGAAAGWNGGAAEEKAKTKPPADRDDVRSILLAAREMPEDSEELTALVDQLTTGLPIIRVKEVVPKPPPTPLKCRRRINGDSNPGECGQLARWRGVSKEYPGITSSYCELHKVDAEARGVVRVWEPLGG